MAGVRGVREQRRNSNPAGLTPTEQRIWELHQQGLSCRDIAIALGRGPEKAHSVSRTLVIARDKMRSVA